MSKLLKKTNLTGVTKEECDSMYQGTKTKVNIPEKMKALIS